MPTQGFNIKSLVHDGFKLNVWDVGGAYWGPAVAGGKQLILQLAPATWFEFPRRCSAGAVAAGSLALLEPCVYSERPHGLLFSARGGRTTRDPTVLEELL